MYGHDPQHAGRSKYAAAQSSNIARVYSFNLRNAINRRNALTAVRKNEPSKVKRGRSTTR
jgi:hypothetical protein